MKDLITSIILLTLLGIFSAFVINYNNTKEVLRVLTPTKFEIDLNNNKTIERDEIVCIDNTEAFSLESSDEFYNTYSKKFNLNKVDMISLGYLAQEYSEKTLTNKKVTIKFLPKQTSECKYAEIKLNGINYNNLLEYSGYGIKNGKILNLDKFKNNLEKARKLHLVILNHHSNKYHTLDCKFGKLAHDTVIIPEKQLPKGAIPCKYCHKFYQRKHKKFRYKKNFDIFEIKNIPEPKLTISQGSIELLITNYTKHLKPTNTCTTRECSEFVKLTNEANESIDIAIYGYENIDAITKALQQAKDRGVKIRFVYDENFNPAKTFYQGNNIIKDIAEYSRSDKTSSPSQSNMLMHNKFIIFDNKTVYTGSMNFSKSGLSGYDENNTLIIKSNEIANLYKAEFEQMLNGRFHNSKEKLNSDNRFKIDNSVLEIYFSPQDKSSKRIVEIINNSKQYIYIPAFLITHTQISNALISAHSRGVDVKIILDANSVYTRNTKHAILRQHNIPIKIENYAGKLHSKTMIIDDKYIIMGSMNFSNSGENKNDENLVIIQNTEFAKAYKQIFLYLWTLIPNKYLKYNPKSESPDSIGSCSDGVDNNFNGKIDKADELCR